MEEGVCFSCGMKLGTPSKTDLGAPVWRDKCAVCGDHRKLTDPGVFGIERLDDYKQRGAN